MSSPRDLISRGLRQCGQLAAGAVLGTNDVTNGLLVFNGVYLSLFGDVIGPRLTAGTVNTSTSLEVGRLAQCSLSAPAVLTFPSNPQDGDRLGVTDALGNFATYNLTLNGNGRKIGASSGESILNTNNTTETFFYRQDTGAWVPEQSQAIDDTIPLPSDMIEALQPLVTLRLFPENVSGDPPQTLISLDIQGRVKLWLRYGRKGNTRMAQLAAGSNKGAP